MYKIMGKVDLKDQKILTHLQQDSRQSFTQIGKKVGLPKSVVAYRIKKLEEKGIIKNYYTVIDSHKLGTIILRFYFTYQYTTPEIKKEIIDYFVKCKYCGVCHTTEGAYELVVYLFVRNLPEFYVFWQKTLEKYRDYFAKQTLSFYFQEYIFSDKEQIKVFGDISKTEIDVVDQKILFLLGANARISTKDIAKKLDLTAITVANRIKKMIKQEIIHGFRTLIDYKKTGKQLYKIDIILKKYNKLMPIINYITKNPNMYCVDRTIGYRDLEIALSLENVGQVHKIMEDLIKKFPESIKDYQYISVMETHKLNYIPSI